MMDNLISNSEEYRITFYKIMKKELSTNFNTDTILCFKKIWTLHNILFEFCLFKPFLDENWSEIYTIFYLINNFL